jgi:hypothetical protein
LDEAISKEGLDITSKSLKRLAKAYGLNKKIHGDYVEDSSEAVLRPLSSLSAAEFEQIKKYLKDNNITLKKKTGEEAKEIFMTALAPSVIEDEHYVAARKSLTQITKKLLLDAEFTSLAARNLVIDAIAIDFRNNVRNALLKKAKPPKKLESKK